MFKLNFLSKENDLNKVLRNQKRNKNTINLLFVSLWDKPSENLIEKLKDKYKDDLGEEVFVVDSFHMPHSFIIYEVVKVPQLVVVGKDKTFMEKYLPRIYDYFRLD
jgi:hypothetical protein